MSLDFSARRVSLTYSSQLDYTLLQGEIKHFPGPNTSELACPSTPNGGCFQQDIFRGVNIPSPPSFQLPQGGSFLWLSGLCLVFVGGGSDGLLLPPIPPSKK